MHLVGFIEKIYQDARSPERHIIEYIVVFWLNEILVSATKQQDGSYQKKI